MCIVRIQPLGASDQLLSICGAKTQRVRAGHIDQEHGVERIAGEGLFVVRDRQVVAALFPGSLRLINADIRFVPRRSHGPLEVQTLSRRRSATRPGLSGGLAGHGAAEREQRFDTESDGDTDPVHPGARLTPL